MCFEDMTQFKTDAPRLFQQYKTRVARSDFEQGGKSLAENINDGTNVVLPQMLNGWRKLFPISDGVSDFESDNDDAPKRTKGKGAAGLVKWSRSDQEFTLAKRIPAGRSTGGESPEDVQTLSDKDTAPDDGIDLDSPEQDHSQSTGEQAKATSGSSHSKTGTAQDKSSAPLSLPSANDPANLNNDSVPPIDGTDSKKGRGEAAPSRESTENARGEGSHSANSRPAPVRYLPFDGAILCSL